MSTNLKRNRHYTGAQRHLSWRRKIMQVVKLLEQVQIRSLGDGAAGKWVSSPIDAALNAKTIVLYVTVHEVDSDSQILCNWAHGVDGENWYFESTSMLDSGDDVSKGVLTGNNGSTVFGSKVRFTVEIGEDSSGGGTQKTATVSVYAVFKPF